MSAGKTITAALMGVAVANGLFQLDTPIHTYGVKPHANWSRGAKGPAEDFFLNLTARHLLTQTTGRGRVAPGSRLTYDSDSYIEHLSYLLNATANNASTNASIGGREWATNHFAKPLGIPMLYGYQQTDPGQSGDTPIIDPVHGISAGGDQPLSCRCCTYIKYSAVYT
jgi:hypothetical protein